MRFLLQNLPSDAQLAIQLAFHPSGQYLAIVLLRRLLSRLYIAMLNVHLQLRRHVATRVVVSWFLLYFWLSVVCVLFPNH